MTRKFFIIFVFFLASCEGKNPEQKPFDSTPDLSDRSIALSADHQIRYRDLTECQTRLWQSKRSETPFTKGAGDERIEATRNDNQAVKVCQDNLQSMTR